jgi:cysteine desulfurase
MHGGGQERDIRSGTFDAPAIAAFAVALHHAVAGQADHAAHVRELRDQLVAAVLAAVPGTVLNGASLNGASRLPGNAHFSFPGCEGDALLMLLDAAGIDCSTGSACTAGIPEPSHVLLAMGVDEPTARASLRFSLGRATTSADIDSVMRALPLAVDRAARAGKLTARARS